MEQSSDRSIELMTELLSAIGKRSINNYLRFSLERELEEIATAYRERRDLLKKSRRHCQSNSPDSRRSDGITRTCSNIARIRRGDWFGENGSDRSTTT